MPAINLSPTWTQTTPNIWQTQCSSPHLWFETGEIKTCQARSPTGPAAPHHHLCQLLLSQELFENNELVVHCVISLLHFGLFVLELFLGARARCKATGAPPGWAATEWKGKWLPTWWREWRGCEDGRRAERPEEKQDRSFHYISDRCTTFYL